MAADLHIHTEYSDSTLSLSQIIEEALKLSLNFIAITDHDTVNALKDIKDAPLSIIAGVELSCEFEGREVHILGYGVNCEDEAFLKFLEDFKEHRRKRANLMMERLKNMGLELKEEIEAKDCVTRLHIAELLLKEGYVKSIKEAFDKYLAQGRPAYVEKSKILPHQAVLMLKEMNASAVLAHPYNAYCDDIIGELVECGLVGIEVYYPEHTKEDVLHYKKIAKKYGLVSTGGSDAHGARKWTKIGQVTVQDCVVKKLLSQSMAQI